MKSLRPKTVRHSYRQSINAAPEAVFPLLCPVRELDWAGGWSPSLVVSKSGLAEPDCLFVTPGDPEDTIWIISGHDPDRHQLEMLMVTPERTVGKLEIVLHRDGPERTAADVAYGYTSLGPRGDAFVDRFTEAAFQKSMQTWERELNHFLATGRMLPA